MDAKQIELLEEYKYVDAICRDMLGAEKGVTAYIEQLDETPMTVRYWITEWNDEYRQLKHIRWLRNQIAHSTGSVECSQADVDWLKGFHNRLLTQQDLLAKAHRVIQESQIQNQQQQAKTVLAAAPKTVANVYRSPRGPRKSWILIAVIAALAVLIGILIWIANGGAKQTQPGDGASPGFSNYNMGQQHTFPL